jgi:hypothetical protein
MDSGVAITTDVMVGEIKDARSFTALSKSGVK